MSRPESDRESELGTQQPAFDDIRWSTCSLEDFIQLYWEHVAPCLEAEGIDPTTEKPTHQWFRDHGVRSFLRPCADTTTGLSGSFGARISGSVTTMTATLGRPRMIEQSTHSNDSWIVDSLGMVFRRLLSTRFERG